MLAVELEVIVYPGAGTGWHREVTAAPTWPQIEAAVRRLDRAEYPFLNIVLPRAEREADLWVLNVIGGQGEYGLSGNDGRWRERWRFRDPTRPCGQDLIDIWITDQGASFEEAYLCNDLAVVLRVCRHFAETGQLDEGVAWERWPAEPGAAADGPRL
ncbi:hypothetical protein [Urbifossiella limnaea]|uniref:Uncharacterized protein n=1 Tax=Urbifossiella limnaea TaxID=2528023 RepID=A0A517XL18_9BACT|nr:hypothetical protein [Urbifossiella limnaea]QDU18156.1 hypothetical protein ETAA1_00390 [Urbifossiella limnaea]